jgi:Na+-transporting NADH:ubiquinone oxidoreductase subunit C
VKFRTRGAERAYTVAFMLAVTVVFISAVAGTHVLTAERVERNAGLFLKRGVFEASGMTGTPSAPELLAWFEQAARPLDNAAGGDPTFVVRDPGSGADRATVRVRRGSGLWGPIRAAVGVDAAGSLTGLAILDQNETPGLGARIAEPWFRLQFRGKRAPVDLDPEGTRAPAPDRVDAVTGATISSRAVRDLVNRAAAEAAP